MKCCHEDKQTTLDGRRLRFLKSSKLQTSFDQEDFRFENIESSGDVWCENPQDGASFDVVFPVALVILATPRRLLAQTTNYL